MQRVRTAKQWMACGQLGSDGEGYVHRTEPAKADGERVMQRTLAQREGGRSQHRAVCFVGFAESMCKGLHMLRLIDEAGGQRSPQCIRCMAPDGSMNGTIRLAVSARGLSSASTLIHPDSVHVPTHQCLVSSASSAVPRQQSLVISRPSADSMSHSFYSVY